MARCCGGGCSCRIEAGNNTTVTGIGSSGDPFVVSTDVSLMGLDNDAFDLAVTGDGTAASPWVISVGWSATAGLDDIPDVQVTTVSNAQVLGWDASIARWTPRNPTTAASGSVDTDTTLEGDGSAGDPLGVVVASGGLLSTTGGVGLSDSAKNQIVRKFADATARASASPAPTINSLSVLDTVPGQIDYWTGSQWLPTESAIEVDAAGEDLLALSGSYVDGMRLTMLVREFSGVTASDGSFTLIAAPTIAGRAGVLTASVTVTGAQAYVPVLAAGADYVYMVARRVDNGALLASQAISGQYVAYLY
jgi:hypothetical protein